MTLSELHLAFHSLEHDILHQLQSLPRDQFGGEQVQETLKRKMGKWPRPIAERLISEVFGFGPLEKLLDEEELNEILILNFDNIIVERQGRLEKFNDQFLSPWTYKNFVQRLFSLTGAKTDLNLACVDTQWNGFRLHIVQKPLVSSEFQISLRKHPNKKWQFKDLLSSGFIQSTDEELLRSLLAGRRSFLVVGPTGSGKTTFLKACLNEIETQERVVILEDTKELETPNDFSSHLLCRSSESAHLKNYDLSDLLRQSLRMRPDRLVVGEIRGGEAKDLLMALSTGHEGSMGSLHASTAQEALFRLEFLIQIGAPQWSLESIRRLIFMSLHAIVVIGKEKGQRKLKGIYRLSSLEKSGLSVEQIRPLQNSNCYYATTSR